MDKTMADSLNEIRPEASTLHSGTNEVEIISFQLNWLEAESGLERKIFYGINAGKVMELVAMPEKLTVIQECSHQSLKGVFLLRNRTIPLIDLCEWFGYEKSISSEQRWTVIVTEIYGKRFGFLTHGVDKVHRVSWSEIKPPPEMIAKCKSLTGICLVEGRVIQMVDFEHIIAAIDPAQQISSRAQETMKVSHAERNKGKTVVVAEDSRTILQQMREMLERSGFEVVPFADGEAAWHYLKESANEKDPAGKAAVAAIISDIEMPRMDGLRLCSLVRDNVGLKHLPVILFSSMINEAQRRKGRSVGATDQVTKPEIGQLVERLEACLG